MTDEVPINSEQQLHMALRQRWQDLGVTSESIDAVCKFPDKYTAKLLGPKPVRRLSSMSRYAMINVLGLELVLRVSPENTRQFTKQLTLIRRKPAVLAVKCGRGKHREVSKKFLRKIAPRGGNMRAHMLTAHKRTKIARKAARARWYGTAKATTPTYVGKPKLE